MIERLLRAAAVVIALVGLLDPPVAMSARPRPRIAVTVERPAGAPAAGVRDRLARDLRSDFDVVPGPDPDAPAAIVIGDRYPHQPSAFSQRTSTVTIDAADRRARARIAGIRAPRAVPRGTRIHLEVDLDAVSASGSTSVVTVSAGAIDHPDVEVARASHAWTAGARRVSLGLDAMPLDLPPWHLRVRLSDTSQTSSAETSDLLVEEAPPLRVLFYEPRPSWIATFVRRALERDPRFAVSGLGFPSRGVRISSGDAASLDPPTLRRFAAVIVGGLDRLTVADRDALDRFARERGGALVLLPDARISAGPARDWMPGDAREVLLEGPAALSVAAPLPAIRAAEMLTFSGAMVPGATVLGAYSSWGPALAGPTMVPGAVVTLAPRGAGRVLLSGALDAWRYRADDQGAFDRFWRSAIAGVALAAPPAVEVAITPPVASPGETVRVVARVHRPAFAAALAGPLRVSARMDTGNPLRLWPEAEADTFGGSFVAGAFGLQRVIVSAGADDAGSESGAAFVAVDPTARHAEPIVPPLAMLAASRGGINVTPEHLADLEARIRRDVTAPPRSTTTHPMRSAWWIVPFATCLSGEWWLRRRLGLR